jgi:hypothetical protein
MARQRDHNWFIGNNSLEKISIKAGKTKGIPQVSKGPADSSKTSSATEGSL